jgi:hypothetical protein
MKRTIAVTLFVLAAGCKSKEAETPDTAAAAAASATPAPPAAPAVAAVHIVSPADGDTVSGDVTVVLGKENVTIAKADGGHVEGTGHHHLFLDAPPSPDGQPIPPASATVVHIGTGDSTYTFKGLKPGAHELIAVIGYGDHIPMSARRDTVRFIVKNKKK